MTDLSKYNTFHLEYYKISDKYVNHILRPSVATYEDVIGNKSYVTEGAVMIYDNDKTLEEIILDASIKGMSPDFIYIYADDNSTFGWSNRKCIQFIDVRKCDATELLNAISLPRFHVAKNRRKSDLSWCVVDRHVPKDLRAFLEDGFSDKDVIAAFKSYDDAVSYCESKNDL